MLTHPPTQAALACGMSISRVWWSPRADSFCFSFKEHGEHTQRQVCGEKKNTILEALAIWTSRSNRKWADGTYGRVQVSLFHLPYRATDICSSNRIQPVGFSSVRSPKAQFTYSSIQSFEMQSSESLRNVFGHRLTTINQDIKHFQYSKIYSVPLCNQSPAATSEHWSELCPCNIAFFWLLPYKKKSSTMSSCTWFLLISKILFVLIYVIICSSDFFIDSTLSYGYTTVRWTIL